MHRPAADLIADSARLSFLDEQTLALPRPMAALEVWNRMMARPRPMMATAMRIRDAISARFGVERIGGFSGRAVPEVAAGDRHLEAMTCVSTGGGRLAITTSVRVKNRFGRVYMLPVRPAHRLIVWWMLRRLRRDLAGQIAG